VLVLLMGAIYEVPCGMRHIPTDLFSHSSNNISGIASAILRGCDFGTTDEDL
jgi:hypothetical protein